MALRYLQGDRCPATAPGARATSLDEAIAAAWPELSAEDRASALAELERSLEAGDFAFLLVAQRFTDSMQRTTQYLNDQLRGPLVHLVELVRFRGEDVEAFEARVVLRGGRTRRAGGTTTMRVEELVAAFPASATESVARLLETAETLGLHVVPGSVGLSLRIDAPEREEPVSVGWLFPPGRSGWYGLRDLTLGFDPGTAAAVPGLALILRRHAERVAAIAGSLAPNKADFPGARFTPELLVARRREVIHALEELAAEVGGG